MKNHEINTTLFLLAPLLFVACKKAEPVTPLVTTEYVVETLVPTGNERFLTKDSDYIFDQTRLHTFEINLPNSQLNKLDADPAAEKYVAGTLTFEGKKISPIGIRYKGSIGAFVGCLSGEGTGHKTCTKLSMQLKINWLDPDNKFYGLKKIQLHSQNLDPSQMHERLAYWLFRAMGVPAPRSVHARVIINGQYMGLFALTEEVDGRFTRENFDDGRGNLYKEIWPLDMNGHFKTEVLAPENINQLLNAWITQIRAATIEASAAHGDAITIITWSNALSKLRDPLEYARIH